MSKLMSILVAASFALVLVACGDPGEFEDVPQDEMQQQEGGMQQDDMGGGDEW